jgi:hypothetical protein
VTSNRASAIAIESNGFQEAALSGDSSEAAVREFVNALNSGTPGDAKAGLRVFKGDGCPRDPAG